MEVVQLENFKPALKAQQMVAIHDLGENREILAVERSADETDQTGRSAMGSGEVTLPYRPGQLARANVMMEAPAATAICCLPFKM